WRPWPTPASVVRGDAASDSRVAGPTDHRGFSLDISTDLPGGDNDRAYGHAFRSRVRAMGIRDRPISPGSPWQNGYVERLIGTVRRECLDRVFTADSVIICGVLQRDPPAPGVGQRCAAEAAGSAIRCHCWHPDLVGITSPLRPDMIFRRDT